MFRFKLSEMGRSAYLYCETGDVSHLGDILRILFWDGKEEVKPDNVIFVDWKEFDV